MAALNEFECSLAFADAAFAHYEYALAVNINEYAVHSYTRRELDFEPVYYLAHELGRVHLAAQDRHVKACAVFEHLRKRLQAAA